MHVLGVGDEGREEVELAELAHICGGTQVSQHLHTMHRMSRTSPDGSCHSIAKPRRALASAPHAESYTGTPCKPRRKTLRHQ